MNIKKGEVEHSIYFFAIEGKCNGMDDANILHKTFEKIRASGINRIVIDASDMTYVVSAVIGKLVHFAKLFRGEGGGLCIMRPHQRLRDEFKITQLDTFFGFCDTKEEAIAQFQLKN